MAHKYFYLGVVLLVAGPLHALNARARDTNAITKRRSRSICFERVVSSSCLLLIECIRSSDERDHKAEIVLDEDLLS